MEEITVSETELIQQAFYYLNTYKRHRALEQVEIQNNNRDQVTYHCLKQYQMIDALELALRAIQKDRREADPNNYKGAVAK